MPRNRFHVLKEFALGSSLLLFCGALLLNIIAAISEGLSFGFILLSLKEWSQSEVHVPTFLARYIQPYSAEERFLLFLILAISTQVFRSVLTYLGKIAVMLFGLRVQKKLQAKVYRQILSLSFPCVNKYKMGDLLEYAKIPTMLATYLLDPLNQFFVSGFMVVASFCIMLFLSYSLTFFAIVLFGAFIFSQKILISKISRISQFLADFMFDFSKQATQNLQAIRVIHTFHRQSDIVHKTLENLDQISKISKKLNFWGQSISPITETAGIVFVGLFLILGQSFTEGSGSLAVLLTFVMIMHRLNARMQLFLHSANVIASQWGQVLRLGEILDPEGKEFAFTGEMQTFSFAQNIVFSDVQLKYEGTQTPALQNLNFSIAKGSTIAFVGSSGAGKSSILDLLLRLYEPTGGVIQIDGVNLQDLDIGSWRSKLGVVSQDAFIFNETIEANIFFGRPQATREEVVHAAKMAGAHQFISLLPQQYETIVGERGYRLSGGERQRVTLARALIREPEVLILDEATSSLDSLSEQSIQIALNQLQGIKTVIIVAHRLSTIAHADQVFVLDRGQIVETGSHNELLKLGGKYAAFWKIQERHQEDPLCETVSM